MYLSVNTYYLTTVSDKTDSYEVFQGLCAQIMHIGPYEDEPATIEKLERFITESGYHSNVSDLRRHHEIYLNDPRKVAPDKNKTIIRPPLKKA